MSDAERVSRPAEERPSVCYYAPVGCQACEETVLKIGEAGFFCILQPIDLSQQMKHGAGVVSGSRPYHIIDLQEETIESARFMLKMSPEVKGRVIVVESSPTTGLAEEGLVSTTPDKIIDTLLKLRAASIDTKGEKT